MSIRENLPFIIESFDPGAKAFTASSCKFKSKCHMLQGLRVPDCKVNFQDKVSTIVKKKTLFSFSYN